MVVLAGAAHAQNPSGTSYSGGIPQRVIIYNPVPLPISQSGSFTVTPGTNSPTEQTQVIVSTTLAALLSQAVIINANTVGLSTTTTAILARANLLATEATLATRASEATAVAISTTNTAILSRLNSGTTVYQGAPPWTVGLTSGTATVGVTNGRLNVDISAAAASNDYAADTGERAATTASTDNPIMLLVNLSTNTVNMRLNSRTFGCNVTNVQVTYRTFVDPVVSSSGTAISIANISASTTPAQAQAFYLPTVTSRGTAIESLPNGQNAGALVTNDNKTITLAPGKKMLLTANPASNNRNVYMSVKWTEQ